MTARTARLAPFAALVAAAALAVPAPATAAPADCDQTITDSAGILGSDLAGLRHDVDTLAQHGATVRVRTYGALPSGGMDAAEQATELACPSWRSGGHRAAHLIAFTVSKQDRRTGLYYGSAYSDALDGQWADIQRTSMNDPFKTGRFAQGLSAGVRAVDQRVTGSHTPSAGVIAAIVAAALALLVAVIAGLARQRRRGPGRLPGGGASSTAIIAGSAATAGGAASAGSASGGGGSTGF
jgi:uncharacterized membrane protein YgcG